MDAFADLRLDAICMAQPSEPTTLFYSIGLHWPIVRLAVAAAAVANIGTKLEHIGAPIGTLCRFRPL